MKTKFNTAILLFCLTVSVAAQTGGTFTINQSVVAAGGGNSAVRGGFWTFDALAPTAAEVSVGGRVRTNNGIGIRNARVTLTASNGAIQTALTAAFGYYRFENIPAGETCVISVSSKRFTFSQPTVVRSVFEEISDLDFIADFNELSP